MKVREVAAAIIVENGRVLLTRRGKGQMYEGKWEFPGGKVEQGESPEECVRREIREELGVEIEVGEVLGENVYHNSRGTVRIWGCMAHRREGDWRLTVHDQMTWATAEELTNYDLVAADVAFIADIRKRLLWTA